MTLAKYVDSLYPEEQAALESEAAAAPTPSPSPAPEGEDDDDSGEDDGEEGENSFDPTDYTGKSYFVHLMNEKAKELGCENTHFTNAHGLHNPNHYTTAREMAIITNTP